MFEWLDPMVEVPANSDEIVLVICSGRADNVTLKEAYMLANYDHLEEEWILEMYPEMKNISVK